MSSRPAAARLHKTKRFCVSTRCGWCFAHSRAPHNENRCPNPNDAEDYLRHSTRLMAPVILFQVFFEESHLFLVSRWVRSRWLACSGNLRDLCWRRRDDGTRCGALPGSLRNRSHQGCFRVLSISHEGDTITRTPLTVTFLNEEAACGSMGAETVRLESGALDETRIGTERPIA